MTYQRLIFLLVLVMLIMQPVLSQPLTLHDAVLTALAHNPEIAAADDDITAAKTKIAQLHARENITVSVDTTLLSLSDEPSMAIPDITLDLGPLGKKSVKLPNMPLSNDNVTSSSINAQIPLSTGGRVKYGLEQIHYGIEALQARAQAKREEVTYAVISAYFSAVLANRLAIVNDDAYRTVKEHVTQAQALCDQGQVAKYEVIRAETELANQDRRRLDAYNQAELALAYLQDLLGSSSVETPVLTTGLEVHANHTYELPEVMTTALRVSNTMKALEARDQMYLALVKTAHAETNPVVAAIISKRLFINDQPFTMPSTMFSIMIKIPLLDGGLAKAEIAEARALRQHNTHDMQRLSDGIRLEVRKYYLDYQSAQKALATADKAVELSMESLRLASRRFEEAQGTGLEKNDARLALSLAETNREGARYQCNVAYYGMQKALGTLLSSFQ